ncbi:uncharacterized protein LOC123649824 [Lemur catta]|uniref:uncharacterized protein LOC123649824 n=1 Tax=Lemur catta TaxID=9447 RepID=UPI001E26BF14|nr:uncharacterized protein LOC123649824 [Lemur catta]XP_045423981.1 uncharacterized protein LOC123649824 [Lemur catta]XP_045423983.1 uncharacterized protein LOC123649824 [Lemur catta]
MGLTWPPAPDSVRKSPSPHSSAGLLGNPFQGLRVEKLRSGPRPRDHRDQAATLRLTRNKALPGQVDAPSQNRCVQKLGPLPGSHLPTWTCLALYGRAAGDRQGGAHATPCLGCSSLDHRAVAGWITASKDVHAVIPRTCTYVPFPGKRAFADIILMWEMTPDYLGGLVSPRGSLQEAGGESQRRPCGLKSRGRQSERDLKVPHVEDGEKDHEPQKQSLWELGKVRNILPWSFQKEPALLTT